MKKINKYIVIICLITIILGLNMLFETKLGKVIVNEFIIDNELTIEEKKWLADHGSIIFGADGNYAPLMFWDEEIGQYIGFTVDYLNALSIEVGGNIKPKSYVWEDAIEKILTEETDFCDMFPSKERAKIYDFSDPIFRLRTIVIVPESNKDINELEDLEGKRIAIPEKDFGVSYLNKNYKNITYIYTDSFNEAVDKVLNGEADALLGDEPVVTYYIEKQNNYNKIRILDEVAYSSDVVFAMKKGNIILQSILNKGIREVNRKDIVNKIQLKWFGFSESIAKNKTDKNIIILLGISLLTIIVSTYLSYLWNKSLRLQVLNRTEELSSSKEELKITFDSITNLLIVIDDNYAVVDVNQSFLDFLDKEKKDIIGKNIFSIGKLDVINSNTKILEDTFNLKTKIVKEVKYESKIFEIKTFPFKKNNTQVKKTIIMIEDITNEKMLENQVLHSSKMAAIGQLAAGVAHEIRNPIGLIRNYNYVLEKKIKTDDENIKKSIKVIGESVEVTSNIIDNLLNFSRMFGDKWEMTNFNLFLNEILELEKVFIKKKKIKCLIECDKSIDVIINRESMKHIIINLLGNAIDAMPIGGYITLSAAIKNNELNFTCKDTGLGISEDEMESIFNPFYTKKISGKGTGLGLYVVYNEIKKHGGEINVESVVNKGTTFNISLPLKTAEVESK